MSDYINKMRKRAAAVSVTQHKYNLYRSKIPKAEIAIVEGDDDVIFYSSIFKRIGNSSIEHFFKANGKDNVLGLRDIILNSKDTPRGEGVVFFIDRDFDNLKNHKKGNDIYITPTYSIENLLVCKSAFKNILLAEFKLCDPDLISDLESKLDIFDKMQEQHAEKLFEVNQLIYCVRQEALEGNYLTSGSISEKEEKFAKINQETLDVIKKSTGEEIEKLICASSKIESSIIEKHKDGFLKLTPSTDWRGKFIFYLFRKILEILVEDRNKKDSKYFSKGQGNLSLKTESSNLIRILSSGCIIPDCLKVFIERIPNHKLR